jgi:hypothetical protein
VTVFTLTFAHVGDGPPPDMRLKGLLKTALRRYRLRCLSIKAEKRHQTAQDGREGNGMSSQSAQVSNASEGRKNAGNRPSGQQRTGHPTLAGATPPPTPLGSFWQ